MPTKNLPGFYGGVSTQAPTLRLDSQVEAMENCITSLLKGTEKRPPAALFKSMLAATADAIVGTVSTSFVTGIIKSDTEAYLLVITDNAISGPVNIYNLTTGVKATITYVLNGANSPKSYLVAGATDPKDKLKATTIEDYTFVTNNTVVAAKSSGTKATQDAYVLFHVAKGQVSTVYTISVTYSDEHERNETITATYTSGAAEVDTTTIATGLATALDVAFGLMPNYPQFKIYASESFVFIQKNAWVANALQVATDTILAGNSEDGLGGAGIRVVSNVSLNATHTNFVCTAGSFADLPAHLPKGAAVLWAGGVGTATTLSGIDFTVRLKEETADNFGYYVGFDSTANTWSETLIPGGSTGLNVETLPVQLVKTAADAFNVEFFSKTSGVLTFDIVLRTTGDDDTVPFPKFIGSTIQDVCFYKNRLGFLAADGLFLSKSADYFNFFATTATDVLDDDPIDLSASNTTTASIILKDAFVWNEKLLINATGRQQLTLSSGGTVLSPKSSGLDIVTNFDLSTTCRPVGSGANVYYSENSPTSSNLREFYLQDDGITKDALNLSSHVEGYLPTAMKIMASYPVRSMLLMLPATGAAVYVYQYLQGSEGKAQSAFHKWTISGHTITGMVIWGGAVYLLTRKATDDFILKLELDRTSTYGSVLMDFCKFVTGTYAAGTGLTTFVPPYAGGSALVIAGVTTGKELQRTTDDGSGNLRVIGDYSTADEYILGIPYTSTLTLSEIIHRDQQGIAMEELSVKLQKLQTSFRNTGYFRVTAVPRGGATQRKTISKEFWWYLLNLDTLSLMTLKNSADMPYPFSCMLQMGAKGALIKFINDSYLPMELMNTGIIYSLG